MAPTNLSPYRLPANIKQFQDRVVAFCENHVRARAAEIETSATYPDDLHARVAQQGLLGANVPDDCGGLGLGFLGRTILIEEVARVSVQNAQTPCTIRGRQAASIHQTLRRSIEKDHTCPTRSASQASASMIVWRWSPDLAPA